MAPKLVSSDIPQAPRLSRVRALVDAVASGIASFEALRVRTKMQWRDARYYLGAATRVLDLLALRNDRYILTTLGARLVRTQSGSGEESDVLAEAIRQSDVVRAWAGDLLAPRPPTVERLVRRAEKAGLSRDTALQRTKQLLSWRKQILGAPRFRYGTAPERPSLSIADVAPRVLPVSLAMLRSLHLVDFKSFADSTIALGPLTVFVGANASGKSNALDAIRFLQGLALELSVSDVLRGRYEGGRLVWPPIRGGIPEVCRSGAESFGITTRWRMKRDEVTHRIECTTAPAPLVTRESLVVEGHGKYLFDTHAKTLGGGKGLRNGGAISVALRGTGGKNPVRTYSASASLLGQITPVERADPGVKTCADRVQTAMKGATFLSITAGAMRDYAPRQALQLGADGENISSVVRQLCDDKDAARRLVDWLSELCAPRITGIDFVETELGDVMLQLIEEDGTRVSARSLSDGTLRFLGELVALLTAPPGTILLMEEIENGLHPQRLHLLVELLEATTRDRQIQVIATTHSPLVLNALSPQALAEAAVFARLPDMPGTVARRLGDLPHFGEVSKRRRVDELFASGWLERAL